MNFLKAGGTTFFSAKCIALLAEYGYEADDFGSHEHVSNRLKTARDRTAAFDQAKADGKNPPPPPEPTRRERELGAPTNDPVNTYQAGHLSTNTCMQNERDNPCSNFVYGYDTGVAPCMPHQGDATVAGTEHNRWTQREFDIPNNRPGAQPRGPYTGDPDADADARTRALLAERGKRPQPTGTEVPAGAGPTAASTADPNAASAPGGSAAKDAGKPVMEESQKITGNDAAECINNFRKGAEAGMRSNASDNETIKKNRETAGTQAERDAAKKSAEAAEARAAKTNDELRSANGSVGGHTTSVNNAQRAASDPPTPAQQKVIDERQANLDRAVANRDAVAARADADNAAAGQARGRHTRMQNAHCRAEQGERIQEGASGELGPRNPGRWRDLPRDGAAREDNEHEA